MKKILVKFSSNRADEMDIEGLYVTTAEDHEAFKKSVIDYFNNGGSITYYVGTNEEIEYKSSDELLNCYEVVCSDIHSCGIGALEFAEFLPSGFTGPEIPEDEDEDNGEY